MKEINNKILKTEVEIIETIKDERKLKLPEEFNTSQSPTHFQTPERQILQLLNKPSSDLWTRSRFSTQATTRVRWNITLYVQQKPDQARSYIICTLIFFLMIVCPVFATIKYKFYLLFSSPKAQKSEI